MAEKVEVFRDYNFDASLERDGVWPLQEAVDYLATYLVCKESWCSPQEADDSYFSIRRKIAASLQQAIAEGNLDVEGEVGGEDDFNGVTVAPVDFINWAIASNVERFEPLCNRADTETPKERRSKREKFRTSTIHHERCRAVAEMLWSVEPGLTIYEMALRPEITQFGCEGHHYDARTICRWLATLKNERRPGRRRKEVVLFSVQGSGSHFAGEITPSDGDREQSIKTFNQLIE